MAAGGVSIRTVIEAHLGSRHVTCVLYGSIVGLAVVVALEAHPPGAGKTIASLAGTALAVGLAELYSDVVGEEARTRHRLLGARVREFAAEAAAVAFGAGFPATFFVLAVAGAWEEETAFTLAKWTGLGLIAAYGFAGARLAGSTWVRAVVHALWVGAIGAFLIGLKALVH
jgi:hypothetical protein